MKLSNISIACLLALGLLGCNSSSDSDTNEPDFNTKITEQDLIKAHSLTATNEKDYRFTEGLVIASHESGRYYQPFSVELIFDGAEEAEIYYTLDSTMPDLNSLKYDGTPIEVTESMNIAAIAITEDQMSKPKTYGYLLKENEEPLLKMVAFGDIHVSDYATNTARWEYFFDVVESLTGTPDIITVQGDFINDQAHSHYNVRELFEENVSRLGYNDTDIVFTIGNHDVSVQAMLDAYPQEWFNANEGGYFAQDIQGYPFIILNSNTVQGDEEQQEWLAKELDKATQRHGYGTPLFIMLHHPITGTVMGGAQATNPVLNDLLAEYPNAVVLSGHSHLNVNDQRYIWQGDYSAINTGSMSYLESAHGYYKLTSEGLTNAPEFEHAVQQSLIVEIYEDRIEIDRIAFNADFNPVRRNGGWEGYYQPPFLSGGALIGSTDVIHFNGTTAEEIKEQFIHHYAENDFSPEFPANAEIRQMMLDNVEYLIWDEAVDDQIVRDYQIVLKDTYTDEIVMDLPVLSHVSYIPRPVMAMSVEDAGILDGEYEVTIRAYDVQGNYGELKQVVFIGDEDKAEEYRKIREEIKKEFDANIGKIVTDGVDLGENSQVRFIAEEALGRAKFGEENGKGILNLNRENGYLTLGQNLIEAEESFSFSAWIKMNDISGDPNIISNKNWGSGYNPGFTMTWRGNAFSVNAGNGETRVDFTAEHTLNLGEWNIVVMTYDAETGDFTLDTYSPENERGSVRSSSEIHSLRSTYPLNAGEGGDGGYNKRHTIDFDLTEFKAFDKVLDNDEIDSLVAQFINSHPM
ncbi:LamG-like jellyroll fold domain-containing protein [Vibrio astriarenae]|uniref:LamG-like jellyroll fold domain-containing protein n=1 Tax=Vibrio astriarenae TaxID=1481923 RepID=UPI0037365D7B